MKDLIDKYLSDSINGLELEKLKVWMGKEENRENFKSAVEDHYRLILGLQNVNLEKEYSRLMKKIERKNKAAKRSRFVWYARAAIFIGLLISGYLVYLSSDGAINIPIEENAITLKQDNGNKKVIKENGVVEIVNAKGEVVGRQDGNQLNYKNEAAISSNEYNSETLSYNELFVPNGKKIKLILSDGTIVHVNSGTYLKYPTKFIQGQPRIVLLDGEAFFEVTKDKNHPFVVNVNEINVRVLGTSFNVSSYRDDDKLSAVLVEGSVELYKTKVENDQERFLLTPGHRASWDKGTQVMKIDSVDVREYTSWVDGQLTFNIRTFEDILKVLERHYNVQITNNYRLLDNQRFFAKFDTETLEQVLNYFQNSTPFSYTREGDKIEINEP
ncbi:FecR family protein [Maribacter luteus]|uniref:FecR family protein n=1 Tax=Maribacter luteus TaxID=2594478 RepID=UPI0024900764|nr:FecR domain-containing protein [Maribacter luteus]